MRHRTIQMARKALLSGVSAAERDLLTPHEWGVGEDARLRHSPLFRPTPWGRWILADQFLANDLIWERIQDGVLSRQAILAEARRAETDLGRRLAVCFADPRLKWLDVSVVPMPKRPRSKDFPNWDTLLRLAGYGS
jgi:hypothetical protein